MNHTQTEIDCTQFSKALIVGKNYKNDRISNGVGKTTIFRAIEYAFYNLVASATLDQIIKYGTKKAVVEIDFEIDNNTYRIYRHRTEHAADVQLYIKQNEEWVCISQRTPSQTDNQIKKLIKISHKAFTYSVLFRQADLTGLSSCSDPKARKEILKEPLDLTHYSKLQKIAQEKVKPINDDIKITKNSIAMLGIPDEDIKTAEEELKNCHKQTEIAKSEIVRIESIIQDNIQKIDQLKLSLGSTDLSIHKKIEDSEKKLKELDIYKKDIDKRLCLLISRSAEQESESRTFNQQLIKIQKDLEVVKNTELRDLETVKSQLSKVVDSERKGFEVIAEAKADLKAIKKSLPESGVCPVCFQDITDDHRKNITTEVNEKSEKLVNEIKALEETLTKCRQKRSNLEQEVKTIEKTNSEIKSLENGMELLKSKISDRTTNINKAVEDIDAYKKSKLDVEVKISDEHSHFEVLKKSAQESNVSEINNKIFSLTNENKTCKVKIVSLEGDLSKWKMAEGSWTGKIETRIADKLRLQEFQDKLVQLNNNLRIAQLGVDSFSPNGIPASIIQTIIDDLQFEVCKAIREIRPELEITIDQDLNITYRRNGELRDYNQLSHGQHVYLALAFKRALSKVIQHRVGITLNLLAFDEVDAHLDEFGLDAFSDVIDKWKQDACVFVITHNKDLKDKFSHAIIVEEREDGSEARVVTSW